jgi:hypothetical protein
VRCRARSLEIAHGRSGSASGRAISLWVPAISGTIAFIVLQKTKKQPIVLRNPPEELRPRSH